MAFDGVRKHRDTVNFIGVNFTALDLDLTLDRVAAQASLDAPFEYVATPNVDHVVALAREPARRALYEDAWLTLNDSRVLERLARHAGVALGACPGADLAEALFDRVIDRNEPITIIGGEAYMISALKRRYRLTDVRWHQPPMNLKQNPRAIVAAARFAAAQDARFTLICVGAPQQEMIAYALKREPEATGVGLCLGASLEFLAGVRHRAPFWMRQARLEWLHRLTREPQRLWRRYLVDGPRIFALFYAWRAAA